MRPDFKHLLTERARHHSRWRTSNKGTLRLTQEDESGDYEDWAPGRKISVRKHYTGKSLKAKDLNENLTPLKNFLRDSVGRKWDDVFSEISEACPNDSAVSGHIYQHLYDYVELHVELREDGKIYSKNRHSRFALPLTSNMRLIQYYVDLDGILAAAPQAPRYVSWNERAKRERLAHERPMDNGNWAVKIKGFWHEATLLPIPTPVLRPPRIGEDTPWLYQPPLYNDVYYGSTKAVKDYLNIFPGTVMDDFAARLEKYYGRRVYCASTKQMNSRELRRLNLKND